MTPLPVPLSPLHGPSTVPGRYMSVLRDGSGKSDWMLGMPVRGQRSATCQVRLDGALTVSKR